MGNGQLDKHKGGGELPGVNKFGGGVDTVTVLLEGDGNGSSTESMLRVELAALEEVIIEGEEDLVEEGGTRIDGRTTTYIEGTGRRMGIVSIDYGLDEMPLLIGEVHELDELSANYANVR